MHTFRKGFVPNLKTYWNQIQKGVEAALDKALPSAPTKPSTIHKAMRYSLFAGGKRLRPILCIAAAEACSGKIANALPMACALECIHTYSLIHDDLPCMDDDDLRRGKPTCHKVFGEAVAVLAGDGLLTAAFEIIASSRETSRYKTVHFVCELAQACGSQGLIAGQVADMEGEKKKLKLGELKYIHTHKTADLIACSLKLGAMSANATERTLKIFEKFGQQLGLAFQVIDDILDVTQPSEKLGKSAGKDIQAEKATYPAILGLTKAQKEADRLTQAALKELRPLGPKAKRLEEIAHYLLKREA